MKDVLISCLLVSYSAMCHNWCCFLLESVLEILETTCDEITSRETGSL